MVVRVNVDNTDWWRSYSDKGLNLLQVETGIVYGDSVIDHVSNNYTYQEVDTGLNEEIDDEEALRIITEQIEDAEEDEEDIAPTEALHIILDENTTQEGEEA